MNDKYNRAQFEQYAESQGLRDFEYDQDDASRYRNPFTQREWNYWVAALECVAQAARATPALPVLYTMPDPNVVFADFCERKGYPSDGDGDTALREAFDEGVRMCFTAMPHLAVPSPSSVGAAITDAQINEIAEECGMWQQHDNATPAESVVQSFARAILSEAADGQKSGADHGN